MRITRAVVPSLFTVLNMFSGFLSIIHSSRGEFFPACWLIVLAAGFDALDGVMARLTKSTSAFGVEIDSLSDVVSFGAAPAFMVYQAQLHTLEPFGVLISSFLMVFGGLRLARFNVQLVGFDKDHFVGLPIPMSAMTVVAFMLNYHTPGSGLDPMAAPFLPWLVVALGLLMVSKVKYDTLPKLSRRAIQRQPLKFVLGVLAAVLVAVTGGKALFPLLILFIIFGIILLDITPLAKCILPPGQCTILTSFSWSHFISLSFGNPIWIRRRFGPNRPKL
jgi:CDP-diacylglycerol--serine O-phosphatidyltransferase